MSYYQGRTDVFDRIDELKKKLNKLEEREGALLAHAWASTDENIHHFAEVLRWCGYTKEEATELVVSFSIDDGTITDDDVSDAIERAYRR